MPVFRRHCSRNRGSKTHTVVAQSETSTQGANQSYLMTKFTTYQGKVFQYVKEYGPTGLVFHGTIFASTFTCFYYLSKHGIDVKARLTEVLDRIKMAYVVEDLHEDMGTAVVAYGATIATGPLRTALTLSMTPMLVRIRRRLKF
eukprot:Clim_evm89s150 gene=Clim_evmTU89s150